MFRSAIDATRFTATKPQASFKPAAAPSSSSSSSTFPSSSSSSAPSQPFQRSSNPSYPSRIPRHSNFKPNSSSPPSSTPTETPAQKIARLRAERNAKRLAEITLWDRIVMRGRVVADIAHRVTVLGLVAMAIGAWGITAFALTDMIIYNRRKRNAYYADKTRERQENLMAAIENEKAGLPLSEEQALILNQERIRFNDEEERARRKRERWQFLNVRRWLVSGLKSDEEQADRAAFEGSVQPTSTETPEFGSQEPPKPEPTAPGGVLAAVENARRVEEKQPEAEGAKGGALDRMAARAAELGQGKGRWGWGSGKE